MTHLKEQQFNITNNNRLIKFQNIQYLSFLLGEYFVITFVLTKMARNVCFYLKSTIKQRFKIIHCEGTAFE